MISFLTAAAETPEGNSLHLHSTVGKGDCAFHAILGEWDSTKGSYYCPDIAQARNKLKAFLLSEHGKEEDVFTFTIASIAELVMSLSALQEEFQYIKISELREKYEAFLNKNQRDLEQAKENFLYELFKHKNITTLIYRESSNPRNYSLYEHFHDVFNREDDNGELHKLIEEQENLVSLFHEYNVLAKENFDWKNNITNEVINEHVEYVGTPGRYLLASEVALIAYAFDRKVIYYPTRHSAGVVYNPEGKHAVHACFNGRDHYERVTTDEHEAKLVEKKFYPSKNLPVTLAIELCTRRDIQEIIDNYRKPAEFFEDRTLRDQKAKFLECLLAYCDNNAPQEGENILNFFNLIEHIKQTRPWNKKVWETGTFGGCTMFNLLNRIADKENMQTLCSRSTSSKDVKMLNFH